MTMYDLIHEPIDVTSILGKVNDPSCGALVLFLGTVRNQTHGRLVESLYYEAYESMARKELERLGELAKREFAVTNVVIVHRLGKLGLGEISVLVAATAPHRSEAFRACQFLIDRIKQDVPIWKKEIYADSAAWV